MGSNAIPTTVSLSPSELLGAISSSATILWKQWAIMLVQLGFNPQLYYQQL